ncbi:MAG: delta-aminolevulinic acid dehydratase, partial [bacterium]|nr:delta-aminolevulinic acid dehydratase [bacterium]
FDWQSSVVSIPAYGPTVVATGIITNALFQYYKFSGSQTAKELISNSVDFVLKDLNRTNSGDNFCFSYSPFDKQTVYNANMKAVRLLSQAYSITKNDELKCKAKDVVKFVINHQNEEGSWFYSNRNNDKRIDNYHTGYVLDCLDEYIKCTNDNDYINNLNIGFQFYKNLFFDEDGFPKFFHNNKYPLDCTAGAQSILTLIRFGEIEHASRVADYLVVNMQNKEGYFYFRKFKNYTIKTSYMRWSNAWMFAALSYLEYKKSLN